MPCCYPASRSERELSCDRHLTRRADRKTRLATPRSRWPLRRDDFTHVECGCCWTPESVFLLPQRTEERFPHGSRQPGFMSTNRL
jgi:hypothetical protein